MEFRVLKKYREIEHTKARYIILMGGRGAGRSYVVSQLITKLLRTAKFFRGAVMRFILGDIRNSIYQEVIDRIEEQNSKIYTPSENTLQIHCGSNFIKGIGFRKSSGDQKSKLKSLAQFNFVHIEEADEVAEEDFMQLDDSLRTIKGDIKIVLTLNCPDKNHWIIKRWFNLRPSIQDGFYQARLKDSESHNTLYIHTTYHDNLGNLNQSTRDNYKRYSITRPDYYWNMIMGLVSEGARGRIFKNWDIISPQEFEALPYASYYALDFGFSNHPTCLVEIKEHNENIWVRELIYEAGLTNQKIAERMGQFGISRTASIFADSAEPKSIAEILLLDWNIMPSVKGPDSIRAGIDMLLEKKVFYTEDSKNVAFESQEYRWALDKNKEPTNEPVDEFNHAMDAIRYGVFSKAKEAYIGFA